MQNTSLLGFGLLASLTALVLGCSAESASPEGGSGNTGTSGSTATGSGGSATAFGGATSSSGGATISPGGTGSTSGGAAMTSGGASSSMGGSTGATMGGASSAMGGSTTTASGGSTTTTSGGSTTTTSGGSTGTTTSGGSGGAAMGCADGCAELKVPFAAYKSAQAFEIYLTAPVDLSAAMVNVKLRVTAGKAGGIQVVVKNGETNKYAWAQTAWSAVSDAKKDTWTTLTLNPAMPSSMDSTNVFDKTQVSIITIQVAAGDPWYSDMAMTMVDQTALVNPTVVQVDEITVSGATGVGPWQFKSDVLGLEIGKYEPITGSTVTWLPGG